MPLATLFRQGCLGLYRDLRNPHLLVVAIALSIAVAGMTAVATFTDRIDRGLTAQASSLLAGDLALNGAYAIADAYRSAAAAEALAISEQVNLRSMISRADGMQMIELKAVGEKYPLRGELQVATAPFATPETVRQGPSSGNAWIDARLLGMLHARIGQPLRIGAAVLTIDRILIQEPDRAGDLFSIAPRVMMNIQDLRATRLLLPGSQAQYSLIVAGAREAVSAFAAHVQASADKDGIRIVHPAEARPEIRSALDRAEQFLNLAALVATTLAGLAILVAGQSFTREQIDSIAVWRTLGATRRTIGWRYTFELLVLGIGAAAVGAGVGIGLESGLARTLSGWLQGALPQASWLPGLVGLGRGVLALLGFSLPQVLALLDVSPARVLRRDLPMRAPSPLLIGVSSLSAVGLLAPWHAGDPTVTLYALAGLGLCLLALFAAGRGLIWVAQQWPTEGEIRWRAGLINLKRRPTLASLQICALGLSIMALMLLTFVRRDLVTSWTTSLPANAPDHFVINIEPSAVNSLAQFLADNGITAHGIYAMTRGRLIEINGQPVRPDAYTDPRARRLADRESNLSAADTLKDDNRIVAGKFWQGGDPMPQFSLESGIAKLLGVRLGDTLIYQIAEQRIEGKVTSLRAVNWETMQANFFVLAPTSLLAPYPSTYLTSFKLPTGRFEILQTLAERYPSSTVIDVMALVRQVRAVMDKALAGIEFVFLFTVAAGITVIFAAVQATHGERLHDATVMKTLGATRRQLLYITSVEFLILGGLAGVIGGLGASAAAWLLATRAFHLGFSFHPGTLICGSLIGAASVWLAGLRAIYSTWRQPAAQVLRDWS